MNHVYSFYSGIYADERSGGFQSDSGQNQLSQNGQGSIDFCTFPDDVESCW